MNKVFKVIWNHATQTWVAVSEFSKAKGKTKSKTLTTISLAVGSVLVSGNSLAATAEITPLKVSSSAGIAITNSSIGKVTAGSDSSTVEPKHVIVIGDQSTRAYDETIMIGYRFSAYKYFGNAGANGKAGDTLVGNRIRIGGGASGQDSFGTALGYGTQVAGPAVAIGVGARADTHNAAGWNATTAGGVAIGDFALAGGNINGSIGIGAIATADQNNTIAIGTLSGATKQFVDRDLAYESNGGRNNEQGYSIDEQGFVALTNQRGGNPASQMISIGYKAGARSSNSIAIGMNATTSRNIRQPVAGRESENNQYASKLSEGTISIGDNTASIKQNSIALGHNATAGGYTEQDIKALNAEKTRLEEMLVDANARKTKAITEMQAQQTAEKKFGLASINAAIERITVALNRIKADLTHTAANNKETTSAIAVGNEARANSTNAIALGYQAKASGVDSISVGHGNNVTGNYSGAFGDPNTVTGNHSYAFGNNNSVKADKVFVLGNTVTVETSADDNRTGAVVLGDSSTVPTDVKAVNSAKIGKENGKKLVYSGFAGNLGGAETNGEPQKAAADKQGRFVSVGNETSPRQVKFVAAGEISKTSTDAINGSQLYAFSDVVNNLAISTATIIGGNAVLNPNGTVSGFSQSLNTTGLADATATFTAPAAATNVATAITNLNDYVNAGWKIAQGDETDAKARISPDEQVNFKSAGLASVTVAANTTNKGADVTYTVTKGEFNATTTDGTISAKDNDNKGKAATVGDVSDAINRAYWKAKAAGNGTDGNTIANDKADQVIAGTEVTFAAGKNLTVDHKTAKTFTFATVDTPNFKGVELVNANTADDKKLTLTPTNAGDLQLNKGTNNAAAKITNVVSGLDKYDLNKPLIGNGYTATDLEMSQDPAYSGLTNLADKSVQDNTAATVGDLRGMGWVVSSDKKTNDLNNSYTDQVKNANEVKFVGTGAAVVSGKTDENTRTITVDVAKGELVNATTDAQTGNAVNTNRGKVTVKNGDADKVATVKNVADAINSAGTVIKAANEHDKAITDADETNNDDGEVVKAGDAVTYTAGKNLRIKRDTHKLTFALANDITVDNANVDTKLTIGKTNPVGITSGTNGLTFATTDGANTNAPVYLNGIKSTLQDTLVGAPATNVVKASTTPEEKARAASVQDVLNSGWNIRGKKQATDTAVANVDFVRTYDTVDFISGDENTTEVTVNTQDNKRTEVSIKAKTGETEVVTAADANKKAGQVQARANANAGTTTDQGSNLATVNAVANAVNSAYWTAKAAGNGVTNDTPDQVTAGTEVTFKAGKNLAVDHSTANTFEFKTKDEVEFTSVQIGTDGPKLTKGDGNTLKVSAVDGTAPVKITNVAAGENDNDAVSYKQFKEVKAATDNTIKLTASSNVKGTAVKKESETSDQKLSKTGGVNFKLVSADDGLLSVKAADDTVTFTPNLGKVEVTGGKAVKATSKTGLVEAEELTEALNKLGWKTNVTNATTGLAETQVVTPGTQVNFVNGKNTVLKATTTRNDQTGQDTTNVTVDVDLPVVYTDAEGNKVVKVGDKYYYADDVENGKLKASVDPDNNAVTNVVASMNNVASNDDTAGNNVVLRNVAEGTKTLAFDTDGNPLVEIDGKYYKLNEDGETADTTTAITPATSEQLKQLDNKYLANFTSAVTGLADLDHSDQSNALSVADAQKLGWVVSASGNDYADSVTNANEVRFNGSNGISVTGETDEHGVRNINVSIAKGNVEGNTTTGVAAGDTNYVTGDQVAKAINESGWKTNVTNATTGLPETKVVTPGTQVDYVNGNGTTANVTLKDGKVAVSYNVNQTTGSVNPNGTATVTDGNAFLNASTVANLVNNSAFNVTTAKVDAFAENQEGKANAAVKAGGNITYTAGKNIAISQNGSNFTFSTTKDIEVDSVTANKRVQIGSGDTAVNLTTDLGALQVADKDGNATQITNVEAGTNVMAFNKEGDQLVQVGDKFYVVDPETNEVDFTKESTPATEEELDELAKAKPALKAYVAYSKAASGLADLDNSEQTNALTVADAQRLGWVVSASGNDYADSVTNANEVRFNGSNGISVTGETDEHGVRNINVSIAKGNVEGNTTTGVAAGDTNYVTGDQVAKAINESGWKTNVTQTNATTGATETVTKVVNPGDSVNYVDGNSTKANVVVTKAADGKETVNVSYDLVTEDHLTPVANNAKSVTKPTNIDAKGKDAATVNDVLNAGWNLQANDEAVDAVTHGNNVNFTSKDGSVKITAKSDGSTSSLDFAVNATSIVNQVAGTISYNKDGKATTNGDGKRIATVGDVANTINNTGWLTNVTDAKGNVTTKVVTPNTQVNYVNGDGTKANVVANSTTGGLDVTFNVKSANPETLTVDGNGVKVNTGSITEATDVAGDANRGKVTVAAGEGNKVATVQNVANAINSASWTVKVADTQEEITTSTANDAGSSVRAGNEITHVAGKNLKVKRDGRNVTYALANDVSVNTVTAQNSIKVGAGNAATTVTTSSAQDGVTEVKLADAAGKATRITNVAAGVKDTDAVNVSQLRNSNAQINQNIAHLNNKVNRMGKDLRAGIAGSNAAAGLPQVYIPGKSMVAAAAGTFKGQSAVAVGYSRASDNGKVILKLQGNANTRGDVGGSVGVGYQW